MSIRLRNIDESNRGDHWRLDPDDECYYLFEYTSNVGYQYSETNSIISNIKKKPSTKNSNELYYKNRDINRCIGYLRDALPSWSVKSGLFVPVPGSKANGHPDYDDRIERICRGVDANADVRPLVWQTESTQADHEAAEDRMTEDDLVSVYAVDEMLIDASPRVIMIVDDVLTTGKHFCAVKRVLAPYFPDTRIVGIFIARRVFRP